MITINSTIVVATEQVSADLAGEAAILNLKNSVYYGLDPVGARIWSLIQKPVAVSAVRDAILEEFDVESEKCQNDLLGLLESLHREGLVEITE